MLNLIAFSCCVSVALLLIYKFVFRQTKTHATHAEHIKEKKIHKKSREFKIYTREEVAKHCSRDDAWVIIKHKETGEVRVYDLTEYVEEHPGGDSILNHVGSESTEGFHGPQHPATVSIKRIMRNMQCGLYSAYSTKCSYVSYHPKVFPYPIGIAFCL
jgi:cytochrome b involved in lipid metabolism